MSTEANEANHIKRDTPVMCVIGNPPYAVSSTNKNDWIDNLIADYKRNLNEKSYNSLSDDYVKFIRYGQHFVDKNGSGILAYISNNSFIDGITHRQMRKNLLETFDKVYILDLHGNAKKKEVCLDGSPDQNVFDIMQGVSINIFVKTGKKQKSKLGKVYHSELYGKRDVKYTELSENSINSLKWSQLENKEPYYFFVPKDFESEEIYNSGFKVSEVFGLYSNGIETKCDALAIHFSNKKLQNIINDFETESVEELKSKYVEKQDSSGWTFARAKESILKDTFKQVKINYRPFDVRETIITKKSGGFIGRSRFEIMQHFYEKENIGLIATRLNRQKSLGYFWVSNTIIERHILDTAGDSTSFFALYVYPVNSIQQSIEQELPLRQLSADSSPTKREQLSRKPNLNQEIVNKIAKKLGLTFTNEKSSPPLKEEYPKGEEVDKYNRISNLPHLKTFRKELRSNLTPAEATLWKLLKGKQLEGRKFRRQHSIGNYILDFYCPSEQIAIELDGQGHFEASQAEYDYERGLFLSHFGIRVLRFENKVVWDHPDVLLEEIKSYFGKQPLSPADSSPFKGEQLKSFAPIDLLDYIYAVLHSPNYREKYKEFLKIDFPRVPYPKDKKSFWQLVKLGGKIRQIHLLESPKVEDYITSYPKDGGNTVTTKIGKKDWELFNEEKQLGRIWINDEQYFDNIPLTAWEFYIGGYQPAQKWLKDCREQTLEFEDILHYQKIIVALTKTDRLMKKIDKIEIE